MEIKITRTTTPKAKPAKGQALGFGKIFTDHMFMMNYTEGKGWHDARVEPFHSIELSPACVVFHYGQEMFEGLKAYRGVDGKVRLFRPEMNARRTNASNKRLCIPELPVEDFVQAVRILAYEDNEDKADVFYREIGREYTKTATKWVMTLILYAVISSLISLIITRINFIDKIPVARVLNTILGGVVGAGEGFIIIMIGALSIKVATVLLGFSDKVVYDTTFFKIFYDIFK